MSAPTIQYKGESRELVLTNKGFMRFAAKGGSFEKLQQDPISQAVILLCAMFDLKGEAIEHAEDFPPIPQVVPSVMQAVTIYFEGAPGESSGDSSAPSPESDTA